MIVILPGTNKIFNLGFSAFIGEDEVFAVPASAALTTINVRADDGSTPIASTDEIVHPQVIYFEDGVPGYSGYNYVLFSTPYPGSDDQYENPSCQISSDGITWEAPGSLTNPFVSSPGGGLDYNADPFGFYEPTTDTWHVYFMEVDGNASPVESKLVHISSTGDLESWGSATDIIAFLDIGSTGGRTMTPSVVRVRSDLLYLYVRDGDESAPSALRRFTMGSPTETLTYGNGTLVTINNLPNGMDPHHAEIHKVGNKYIGIVNMKESGTSSVGRSNYFVTGTDGLTFECDDNPVSNASGDVIAAIYDSWYDYKSSLYDITSDEPYVYRSHLGDNSGGDWAVSMSPIKKVADLSDPVKTDNFVLDSSLGVTGDPVTEWIDQAGSEGISAGAGTGEVDADGIQYGQGEYDVWGGFDNSSNNAFLMWGKVKINAWPTTDWVQVVRYSNLQLAVWNTSGSRVVALRYWSGSSWQTISSIRGLVGEDDQWISFALGWNTAKDNLRGYINGFAMDHVVSFVNNSTGVVVGDSVSDGQTITLRKFGISFDENDDWEDLRKLQYNMSL